MNLSLVMKCERWNDQHNTSVGQKNNQSQTGIKSMTTWTLGACSIHWAIRTHEFFSLSYTCVMLINSSFTIRVVMKSYVVLLLEYIGGWCHDARLAGQPDHEADGNFQQQLVIFDNPTLFISMLRFVLRIEFQASLYRRGIRGERSRFGFTEKACFWWL